MASIAAAAAGEGAAAAAEAAAAAVVEEEGATTAGAKSTAEGASAASGAAPEAPEATESSSSPRSDAGAATSEDGSPRVRSISAEQQFHSRTHLGATSGVSSAHSAERSNSDSRFASPRSAGSNKKDMRRIGSTGQMGTSSKASNSPQHKRRSSHDSLNRQKNISKLKTSIRARRGSLKIKGEGDNKLVAEKNVNFAPIGGTKFHEALAITLQREQEGNNKYRIVKRLKKYRGMRSDSKAENRARKQKKRIEKRQRKGQKQKTKDIIHKQHEQYALTYGMMLGVQMSVGRQFEFSMKRSLDSMATSTSSTTDLETESEPVPASTEGTAAEQSKLGAHPESLENVQSGEHVRMKSLRQFSSAGQKRE
jgi:hypothetical protein